MAGNLVPVTKSGEQLFINFHAFRENRLPFVVRVRDTNQEPVGRIAFMKEPKVARGEAAQTPICNLNIKLPDYVRVSSSPVILAIDPNFGLTEVSRTHPITEERPHIYTHSPYNLAKKKKKKKKKFSFIYSFNSFLIRMGPGYFS